jgi:tetratricopeptide (TPR) repeat protein
MARIRNLVFAVALLALAGPDTFPQTPQTRIEPITSALRGNDFAQAAELSRAALKEFPNDPHLWALQGIALASQGDDSPALAAFQQALKLQPDYVTALQGAAQLQFQANRPEAAPLLNRLLEQRPGDATAHAMLGVLRYRRGDCAAAVRHFEKSGELLDSQQAALQAYAICLVRLHRLDDAAGIFQRAVKQQPQDAHQRQLLAAIQLMAREPQDAIATLQPILAANPDSQTLELASAAYEDAHDTGPAVDTLRQAILLDPRNVNLYLDFATVCYAHQSFQVGVDAVTEGIDLQATAAPLYLARGVLYVQLAEYDKAEADFDKAHELDPTQSLSAAAQGMADVQANDLDHALSTVQAKLARNPNDAFLLYLRADILSQKGPDPGSPDFQAALRSARQAVALQPTLASARSVLAKLYMQEGKYVEAAEQCRKALRSDPQDQTSLYRLIQALRKTNQQAEIPELLKRLAALREQAAQDQRERNRYKLIEGDSDVTWPPPPPRPDQPLSRP